MREMPIIVSITEGIWNCIEKMKTSALFLAIPRLCGGELSPASREELVSDWTDPIYDSRLLERGMQLIAEDKKPRGGSDRLTDIEIGAYGHVYEKLLAAYGGRGTELAGITLAEFAGRCLALASQERLDEALRCLERAFPEGPAGLVVEIGYSSPEAHRKKMCGLALQTVREMRKMCDGIGDDREESG